jgi:hypothetical protein
MPMRNIKGSLTEAFYCSEDMTSISFPAQDWQSPGKAEVGLRHGRTLPMTRAAVEDDG